MNETNDLSDLEAIAARTRAYVAAEGPRVARDTERRRRTGRIVLAVFRLAAILLVVAWIVLFAMAVTA